MVRKRRTELPSRGESSEPQDSGAGEGVPQRLPQQPQGRGTPQVYPQQVPGGRGFTPPQQVPGGRGFTQQQKGVGGRGFVPQQQVSGGRGFVPQQHGGGYQGRGEYEVEDLGMLERDDDRLKDRRLIRCRTSEDAHQYSRELLKLPRMHFLNCFSTCKCDGQNYIVVEKFKEVSYPFPSSLHQSAVSFIIKMAIDLDNMGTIHANFSKNMLVQVGNGYKFYCIPLTGFSTFEPRRDAIETQHSQLYSLIDTITGVSQANNRCYMSFMDRFKESKTLVDLRSLYHHPFMFVHPCISQETYMALYYGDCHLTYSVNKPKPHTFKDLFHKDSSHKPQAYPWISVVEKHGSKVLKKMLKSRIVDRVVVDYMDTAYDFHEFIWNCMRHVNEKEKFWSVDSFLREEIEKLFPNYVFNMFHFMHEYGLNAQFGPKQDALQILKHAMSIIKDGQLYIPNLLATCEYMHYLLAKFYTFCKDHHSAGFKVRAAAKVLEESYKVCIWFSPFRI